MGDHSTGHEHLGGHQIFLEEGSKLVSRSRYAGFYRAGRCVQDFSDLFIRKLFNLPQDNGRPQFLRQLLKGELYGTGDFRRFVELFRKRLF
jgi:hypothetical protein